MTYSTGSEIRDTAIERAIRSRLQAHDKVVTVASVSKYLPNDEGPFDLEQAELDGILSNLEPQPVEDEVTFEANPFERHPPIVRPRQRHPFDSQIGPALIAEAVNGQNRNPVRAPDAPETEQPDIPPTNSTPRPKVTHAEAIANKQAAEAAIIHIRAEVRARTELARQARDRLAIKIAEWHAGGITGEAARMANARAYAATSLAERKARLERTGSAQSHTAAAFVRKRMQNTGNRGAWTPGMRNRVGFLVPGSPAALAQAAARKLPSER